MVREAGETVDLLTSEKLTWFRVTYGGIILRTIGSGVAHSYIGALLQTRRITAAYSGPSPRSHGFWLDLFCLYNNKRLYTPLLTRILIQI